MEVLAWLGLENYGGLGFGLGLDNKILFTSLLLCRQPVGRITRLVRLSVRPALVSNSKTKKCRIKQKRCECFPGVPIFS